MKALKPWLVVLLVFVAGFAGGVVTTRATVRRFVQEALARPDTVRELMEKRMVRRLQLDAQQRQKVHQVLLKRQRELSDLRLEFAPRFFQIASNADAEISAALTPEQREQFEQIRERQRRLLPPLRQRALPPAR